MNNYLGPILCATASCISALASVEIPSLEEIGKLSAVGFLGISVWWLLAKTIPHQTKVFSDSISSMIASHTADRTEIQNCLHRVDCSIKEGNQQQIELLKNIVFQTK